MAASLALPLALFAPSPTASAPAAKSSAQAKRLVITPSKINAMLVASDKARTRKDVNAIIVPLASDAVIKITSLGRTLKWNRSQYKTYMIETFQMGKQHKYKRSNTKVMVARSGQSARVTMTTQESMSVKGIGTTRWTMRGVSDETIIYKVQGGRIVVTSINTVGRPLM